LFCYPPPGLGGLGGGGGNGGLGILLSTSFGVGGLGGGGGGTGTCITSLLSTSFVSMFFSFTVLPSTVVLSSFVQDTAASKTVAESK